MGKALVSVVFLAIGIVIGGGIALFGLGAATGIGVATGLSAGICATVQAAQDEGLLDAAQIDRIMTRAASDLGAATGGATGDEITGTLVQCETVMQRLREAGGD